MGLARTGAGTPLAVLLVLLASSVSDVFSIGVPVDVTYQVHGARTIELSWNYTSPVVPSGYRIVLTSSLGGLETYITQNMFFTITGTRPFDYTSSTGVTFTARVNAYTSSQGEQVTIRDILVPSCPGACNYRYYDAITNGTCEHVQCVCNGAFSGVNCSIPNFAPRNVSGVYDSAPTQDQSRITVAWIIPELDTLAGKRLQNFRIYIKTATTSMDLHSGSYSPHGAGDDGILCETIEGLSRSIASQQNFIVTVEANLDDGESVNSSSPVATHTPALVENLTALFVNASIRVTWQPPYDDDGLITQYQLTFGTVTTNLDSEVRLHDITTKLERNTTYSIIIVPWNSLGPGASNTVTIITPACSADEYYSTSDTECLVCPQNSGSRTLSFSVSDCESCVPGYQPSEQPMCSPCPLGTYKEELSNTSCVPCPSSLSTTASIASISSDNCSICRYSDGTYPTDTCYYFNVTASLTATVISDGFSLSWTGVPSFVQVFDKSVQEFTLVFSVVNLFFACMSTGRGVLPAGYSYNQSITITDLDQPAVNQGANLRGLVEYSCRAAIGTQISAMMIAHGPFSEPILVFTNAFGNSTNALPVISSVGRFFDVITVDLLFDVGLVPFINSIIVYYTFGLSPDTIRSETLPSSLYNRSAFVYFQEPSPRQRIVLYTNSSIGNAEYISESVVFNSDLPQNSSSSAIPELTASTAGFPTELTSSATSTTFPTLSSEVVSSSSFESLPSTVSLIAAGSTSQVGILSSTIALSSGISSIITTSVSDNELVSTLMSISSQPSQVSVPFTTGTLTSQMSSVLLPSSSGPATVMTSTNNLSFSSSNPQLSSILVSTSAVQDSDIVHSIGPTPSPMSTGTLTSQVSSVFPSSSGLATMMTSTNIPSSSSDSQLSSILVSTSAVQDSDIVHSIGPTSSPMSTGTLTSQVSSVFPSSSGLATMMTSTNIPSSSSDSQLSSILVSTSTVQELDIESSISPTPSPTSVFISSAMLTSAMTIALSSVSKVPLTTMTVTLVTTDTPTESPRLQPPGEFTVTVINDTAAMLSWQAVTGSSGYRVTYQIIEMATSLTTKDVIGDSVLDLLIIDLQPFSNYSFSIVAVDKAGRIGETTKPQNLQTPEGLPSPPRNVMIIEEESTILIQWEDSERPNGVITKYVVTITSQSVTAMYDVGIGMNFLRVQRPFTQYSVKVQAVNGAGSSQDASPVGVTLAVTMDEPTSNSLTIPIAVGAGAGAVFFICLVSSLCLCFYFYFRRRNSKKHVLITERPPAMIPGKGSTPLSYYNPLAHESLSQTSIVAQQTDFFANHPKSLEAGEEQYAEISQEQRLRAVERAVTVVPPKEATPSDYNNEDLYMEMEKLYYTDMGGADCLESFEFSRSAIEMLEEVGTGQFGRVMKARAKGIIGGEPTSIVAVKMLKEKADERTRKDFFGEAQLLAKFGSHPNVMSLLKVVHTGDPAMVITHYMPNGDLKHYLKKCAIDKNKSFGTLEQLHIAEQIACGMEYLASKFFIHRDLAARNVLVGEKNLVKISDFGLSRALAQEDSYYKVSQTAKLPVKWMALESLLYQKFSTYSDVWSYGVTMWEIFSYGGKPYPGIHGMNIADHIRQGNRLQCPPGCPQDVYSIMKDCWKLEKETRPTFTHLRTLLKARSIAFKRQTSTSSFSNNEKKEGLYY